MAANSGGGAADGISAVSAAVTICKSLLGSAIFSLSYGLRQGTLLPGLACLFLFGSIAAVSFHMLMYACALWRVTSFPALWQKSVGSSWAMDWIIFINGCLTLVAYTIMIADNTSSALRGLLGEQHPLALGRMPSVLLVALAVLLPLCLAPNLNALRHASAIGLGAMGYAILLVISDAALNPPAVEKSPELAIPAAGATPGIFAAIAIFSQSFVAHYNAPTIYAELKDKRPSSLTRVVATAYGVAMAAYVSFALAGAYRFGANVEGNVLRMYPATTATMFAWLSIAASTAMSYPLVFNSFRDSCVALLCRARNMNVEKLTPLAERNLQIFVALAFIPVSAVIGGVVDDLGIANALTGAVTGCLVAYICPAIVFHAAVSGQLQGLDPSTSPQKRERLRMFSKVAVVIGTVGVFLACVGTVVVLTGVG